MVASKLRMTKVEMNNNEISVGNQLYAVSRANWEANCRLGDVCSIKHGYAFKSEFMTTDDIDDLPIVVNIVNFQYTGGFRFESTKIQRYTGDYPSEFKLRAGDILLVMTCQTAGGEILGVPGRIPNDDRTYLHNQRMGLVVLKNPRRANLDFLYWLFLSPQFNHYLYCTATGAKILHTAPSRIEDFKFSLPPLPTQRKIATILNAYDDLIENNTQRIRILEEMAQALYREWFVRFRFPGHEMVRMVESELGMVPEGWEVKKLGDIAHQMRRSVNPDQINPETPYIGLEHIPRKSIALSEWGAASEVKSTKLAFKRGEILFGKIRPYFHKVGVAPIDGVCSSDTIVISSKASDYFSIVLACVSSEDFVNHATQTSQGTKMPRADWNVLIKYPIIIPPLSLLLRFNEFMLDIIYQIQNMIARNRNLRRTRDLLLPKLISGEVNVGNIEVQMTNNGSRGA